MIRMLVMLTMTVAGATLAFPQLALGRAEDSRQPRASAPSGAAQSGAAEADASLSAAAQKLRAFLEADWRRWMEEYPEHATHVGYPGQDDRWTDNSPAGTAGLQEPLAANLAPPK